mmetsp:Transcript_46162/g.109700  ORF Transcript_46162/g.109700 Transcript_46162/m.109700 type:complete len:210 (-) Transcript_46162:117-746(-)
MGTTPARTRGSFLVSASRGCPSPGARREESVRQRWSTSTLNPISAWRQLMRLSKARATTCLGFAIRSTNASKSISVPSPSIASSMQATASSRLECLPSFLKTSSSSSASIAPEPSRSNSRNASCSFCSFCFESSLIACPFWPSCSLLCVPSTIFTKLVKSTSPFLPCASTSSASSSSSILAPSNSNANLSSPSSMNPDLSSSIFSKTSR